MRSFTSFTKQSKQPHAPGITAALSSWGEEDPDGINGMKLSEYMGARQGWNRELILVLTLQTYSKHIQVPMSLSPLFSLPDAESGLPVGSTRVRP